MFLINFELDFAANVSRNLIQPKHKQEMSLCFPQTCYIHYIKDGVLMEKLNKAVEDKDLAEVNFIFFSLSLLAEH